MWVVFRQPLWSLVLFWGLALAQSVPLETTLDTLTQSLSQIESQAAEPIQALQTLRQTQTTFESQSGDWPAVLRNGILTSLKDAQTAVGRRSGIDLAAQLAVIRGLAGKQAYDAYFSALESQSAAQATPQLQRLLTLSKLPGALAAQANLLASEATSQNLEALRLLLERAHTQAIRALLEQASTQAQPQAFLSISRAYGLYLVIQERSGALSANAFVTPLKQLAQNQTAAYTQSLTNLRAEVDQFLKQVSSPTPSASTPSTTPLETADRPDYMVSAAAGGLAVLLIGLLIWNRRRQATSQLPTPEPRPETLPSPNPTRPPTQGEANPPAADKPWNEEF